MTPLGYMKFQALARRFNNEKSSEILELIDDEKCQYGEFVGLLKEWRLDLHAKDKEDIVKKLGIRKCIAILGIGKEELAQLIENENKAKAENVIELLSKKYRSREWGNIMTFDKEYMDTVIGYRKSANEIIGILKQGNRISEKYLDKIIEMFTEDGEYEEVQEAQTKLEF